MSSIHFGLLRYIVKKRRVYSSLSSAYLKKKNIHQIHKHIYIFIYKYVYVYKRCTYTSSCKLQSVRRDDYAVGHAIDVTGMLGLMKTCWRPRRVFPLLSSILPLNPEQQVTARTSDSLNPHTAIYPSYS